MPGRVKVLALAPFVVALILAVVWRWFEPDYAPSAESEREAVWGLLETQRVTERTTGEHAGTEDLSTTGDFDGDGSPDEAFFVSTNGTYQLVISLSGEQAPVLQELVTNSLATTGIRTKPPGRFTAYCARRFARGGSDCSEGTLRELVTTHDAVMLFTYESAAALLYWHNGRLHTLYWVD